ncbi:hypothetical protein PGH26_00075 [Sporosarcina jeotgali]|uniref:Uncharacterized protein n=1 Tax=Sporosarcina jeotgali TaxID=3020056 RepID=A0ABZ0KZN5_9BACL|nr:hypothetical protein [Sporosarcina sp. B2O-1]WOV84379.1 hypothetical protein PGH26_00075 [Sporosarcina sp. B2O-1]
MSVLTVASVFLGIGIILFPFGIYYLKERMELLESLNPSKKVLAIALEVLDVMTGPVFSGWLLYLSLLLMACGAVLLILVSQ